MADSALPLFVDTAYLHAMLNLRDHWHEIAVRWEARLAVTRRRLVTTELVLLEIGDAHSKVRLRSQGVRAVDLLRSNSRVEASHHHQSSSPPGLIGTGIGRTRTGV